MPPFLTQRIWLAEHGSLLLTVLICLLWLLPGLVGHDPWKPDEAYSFGLVWHMMNTGELLIPTLGGEPFMEKPPLFYWTAAGMGALLHPPLVAHDAARLAAGLFTGLTLLLAGLTARELFGPGKGHLAALLLLGCLGLLMRGHELITDTALMAGMAMAWYGLARVRHHPVSGGLLLGTGVGMAFLAKGLIGPGLVGLTALLLPLFAPWRHRAYAGSLAVAAFAALPWLLLWPLLLWQVDPELFRLWFIDNNFGRFFGTVRLGPQAEPLYYLEILPWYALPALPIALWAWWHRRRAVPRSAGALLTLVSFGLMLAVLSMAHDARDVYALPLLFPLAVAAADGVDSLRREAVSVFEWFALLLFGSLSALLWLGWLAMITGSPASLHQWLLNRQPDYLPAFELGPFLMAAMVSVLWVAWLQQTHRSPRRAVATWAGGITLFWTLAMTLWLPWIDTGKTYRAMIGQLAGHLPASVLDGSDCLASRHLGEPQRALLDYFLGLHTHRLETRPEEAGTCHWLLVQGTAGEEKPPPAPWERIWDGARPGDHKERYWLYRRGEEP